MFGFSKSNAFKPVPFGQTRRRTTVPRWLIWSVSGLLVGAAGLYYAQEKLLPPRLSALESMSVRSQADAAAKARDAAKVQLGEATTKMKAAQEREARATEKMNQALVGVDPLMKDIDLFIKSLPSDPRGNAIGIRAGNFSISAGQLNYHVVFVRDAKVESKFSGTMQMVASGSRGGRDVSIDLDMQPVALDQYKHVQGALALPAGFTPREISVKLTKSPSDTIVSQRVFRLNN